MDPFTERQGPGLSAAHRMILNAFQFEVDKSGSRCRLDKFLALNMAGESRSHLQRLIRQGSVTVNGGPAEPAKILASGDRVCVAASDPLTTIEAEDIPLDILYEDEVLIAVNKPPGLTTHPSPGKLTGTLVNALLFRACVLSQCTAPYRPGIVHRLDRWTSGVMIVAKTDEAHAFLSQQFKDRCVEKRYLALTWGRPDSLNESLEIRMGRHPRMRLKMAANKSAEGKRAVTAFELVEELGPLCLMRAIPKTGRTHQIRVHLAHLGCPIVADAQYGGASHSPGGFPLPKGVAKRTMLHSERLKIAHPVTHQSLEFQSPIWEDMASVIELLRGNLAGM